MARDAGRGARDTPLLLYDGDCRFCSGAIDWLRPRLVRRTRIVPWQDADVASLGLTPEQAARAVWWIEPSGAAFHSERAVAQALRACRRPWPAVARALDARGLSGLAALGYRGVAALRGHLPGPTPARRRPAHGATSSRSRGPG